MREPCQTASAVLTDIITFLGYKLFRCRRMLAGVRTNIDLPRRCRQCRNSRQSSLDLAAGNDEVRVVVAGAEDAPILRPRRHREHAQSEAAAEVDRGPTEVVGLDILDHMRAGGEPIPHPHVPQVGLVVVIEVLGVAPFHVDRLPKLSPTGDDAVGAVDPPGALDVKRVIADASFAALAERAELEREHVRRPPGGGQFYTD